jgi:hypothetical protein
MSTVVSIQQSEPGLYVVNVQRSGSQPLGKILESIAHPPVDDDYRMSNGMHLDSDQPIRKGGAGSSLAQKRRRKNGH